MAMPMASSPSNHNTPQANTATGCWRVIRKPSNAALLAEKDDDIWVGGVCMVGSSPCPDRLP